MSKKKFKRDGVYFIGESANDVTGSQYLVIFDGHNYLLECGLYQSKSNSYLDSYRINSAKFSFNPSEIEYVFVAHPHIDHCGLIPRLVKEGFRGKIITTMKSAMIMKSLLGNCAFIIQEEARILSKRYGKIYEPLYSHDDVQKTLALIEPHDEYDEMITLDETTSFQWLKNSHCVGAAQLQLVLKSKYKTKKILYTSDIGALKTENHYVDDTEIPEVFSDVSIMESTYGDVKRVVKRHRSEDMKLLKTAVLTVLERGGTIVFPAFSFSRTQEILTSLYELFGEDKDFMYPVVVDSLLSVELCKLYGGVLNDDRRTEWLNVANWKNVRYITDKDESKANIADNMPKVVISSSGFCTNGRVINYLAKYLADRNSMIVFSGYVGDNPSYLSYRIKNCPARRTIKINHEIVQNLADCVALKTFSSHANRDDLIKYGSSLNTNKLILVHGSTESKTSLMQDLKQQISKNDRSYKVLCSCKNMAAYL